MRSLKNNELNDINFHIDMLQGCINRMCTTEELDEFFYMRISVLNHIDFIVSLASKRILISEV